MGYYSTDNPFYYQTKQWTTAEIYEEVKSVIEQIIEVEEYVNSDEAKLIQDMLKDCREAYYDYSQAVEICRILYQKGYRKQSDAAREIIEMLKAAKAVVKVHFEAYDELIDNIATKYGVEVEE